MKQHTLKTLSKYFRAVADGHKTFELRKNDRDFKVDDILILQEIEVSGEGKSTKVKWTGHKIKARITYVLQEENYGLIPGWCALGLEIMSHVFDEMIANKNAHNWHLKGEDV